MAKKKATKKAAPKKAAAKPAAAKPIKEALGKSGLVSYISEQTGVASRDVRAVLGSLESAVHGSVSKKGAGSFTLPGLSPDPLPLGMIRFSVSALRIPGADLKNVVFDDLADVVTDISTDEISYSR